MILQFPLRTTRKTGLYKLSFVKFYFKTIQIIRMGEILMVTLKIQILKGGDDGYTQNCIKNLPVKEI